VANCYLPPALKQTTVDGLGLSEQSVFDWLMEVWDGISAADKVCLVGDFNSYTGNIQSQQLDVASSSMLSGPDRNSADCAVGDRGRRLIRFLS
jgi:hypothetical protein